MKAEVSIEIEDVKTGDTEILMVSIDSETGDAVFSSISNSFLFKNPQDIFRIADVLRDFDCTVRRYDPFKKR